MGNLNAVFINDGMAQSERLIKLNQIAIQQMKILELLEFIHREVQSLHQLLELYLVDVLAQYRVLASIANDVHTAEVCNRAQYCVRAIQESNLTLVVWLLVVCDENVKTSLVSRELLLHLLYSHVLSLLDYPEVEALSLYYEVVLVANLLH